MDIGALIKHLIYQEEGALPAIKLVQGNHVEVDDLDELPKLKPSQYLIENRMTTDDRHQLLTRQQGRIRPRATEVRIEPPVIVFQSYKFGETHKFPITVRNVNKKSQKVVLLMDDSNMFKFDECSQRVAKFPCGMCITATITFTPETATEDYFHKLVVLTNRTKIVVPIVAIGSRAILDAPDSLFISDSPVRQWTSKPVTLLNIGKRMAKFTMDITGPFCLKPDKGIAAPSQAFTFEIGYFSKRVASHEGEICIKYDTGEETYIEIKANTINQDISLSSSDIRSEDTFIGLRTRTTIFIENKSNITAKFLWKKFSHPAGRQYKKEIEIVEDSCKDDRPKSETEMEEEEEEEYESGEAETEENRISTMSGTTKSCLGEVIPILNDYDSDSEQNDDDADEMFSDDNFHIYPLFGDVKPRSKIDVHIVFSPKACKFYEGMAYLDITGVDKRMPFKFYGRGLGPKFKLGFEVLNVGDVALGGTHSYEIPVQNISEIPGAIHFDGLLGPPSNLGMRVEPPFLEVAPWQYSAFYANFASIGNVGKFSEEMRFIAKETGDVFYVTITGQLVYPTIQFRTSDVHLGNLSYGFQKTFYFPLINESLNYVEVDLKMASDGKEPAMDFQALLDSFHTNNEHFKLPKSPNEFKLEPSRFTLKPKAVQNVALTYLPNKIQDVKNKVKCIISNEHGKDVETIATVKVRGSVIVPPFRIVEDVVRVSHCYVQFAREAELTIQNSSELPVVYNIVDKTKSPTHSMKITSDHFVGIAQPWAETKVPFEVTTFHAGDFHTNLELHAAGWDDKLQTVTLKCESVPTKVESNTRSIDFGKIEILEEKSATFSVTNPSPFPFKFEATPIVNLINAKGDTWKIEPESGELEGLTKFNFTVKVKLMQAGLHYASVQVVVNMDGPQPNVIDVKLKAQGVGSPLVFDPPIAKTLDFGTIFVNMNCAYDYTVTNRGVHAHTLEWKAHHRGRQHEGKEKTSKKHLKPKPTGKNAVDGKPRAVFIITPQKVTIGPGESIPLSIAAMSDTYKVVEEVWNSFSFISAKPNLAEERRRSSLSAGRKSITGKEINKMKSEPTNTNFHVPTNILHEVKIKAIFEAPQLKFSKRIMNFVIDAAPNQENFMCEELLKIQNIGTLPIKVRFKTTFPFSIQVQNTDGPTDEVTNLLNTTKTIRLRILFDGRHLRKELGIVAFKSKLEALYDGYLGSDQVELRGIVRFPQLHLDRYEVNFGQISNGMEAVETITVTNPGTFCLTYKWYIKQGSVLIKRAPKASVSKEWAYEKYRPSLNNNHFMLVSAPPKKGSRMSFAEEIKKSILTPQRDHFLPLLGIHPYNERNEPSTGDEEFADFFREKMYRTRLMEFMGLRDSEYEAEDEINYLAYYNQNLMPEVKELKEEERTVNELIDIVPLAGVIQAGQSQTFTVVFFGQPDVKFKANLILYVEGGARRDVLVMGSTAHPYVDRARSGSEDSFFMQTPTDKFLLSVSRPDSGIEGGDEMRYQTVSSSPSRMN